MGQPAEQAERPCSCEISRNPKGDISVKVKAYRETLDEAIDEAINGLKYTKQQLGLE